MISVKTPSQLHARHKHVFRTSNTWHRRSFRALHEDDDPPVQIRLRAREPQTSPTSMKDCSQLELQALSTQWFDDCSATAAPWKLHIPICMQANKPQMKAKQITHKAAPKGGEPPLRPPLGDTIGLDSSSSCFGTGASSVSTFLNWASWATLKPPTGSVGKHAPPNQLQEVQEAQRVR